MGDGIDARSRSLQRRHVMINKVILVGNLGKDPEVRSTQSGTAIAQFSLATNKRWRDSEGQRQEATEWHQVVCFGRLAEIAGQYLTRGRLVYVEGRLQTRSWEDTEAGVTRYRTEIVCENLQLLGPRTGADDAEASGGAGEKDLGPGPEDGDIPF